MAVGNPNNVGPFPFGKNDGIFRFNGSASQLKFFHANGMMQWSLQARGIGNRSDFDRDGNTPPGIYELGKPEEIPTNDKKAKALGPWFVPLIPVAVPYVTHFRRKDLGVHGGGSHLPSPLANKQGWETTLGCIRLQNEDLKIFVSAVQAYRSKSFKAWIMVHWFETDSVTKKVKEVRWGPEPTV